MHNDSSYRKLTLDEYVSKLRQTKYTHLMFDKRLSLENALRHLLQLYHALPVPPALTDAETSSMHSMKPDFDDVYYMTNRSCFYPAAKKHAETCLDYGLLPKNVDLETAQFGFKRGFFYVKWSYVEVGQREHVSARDILHSQGYTDDYVNYESNMEDNVEAEIVHEQFEDLKVTKPVKIVLQGFKPVYDSTQALNIYRILAGTAEGFHPLMRLPNYNWAKHFITPEDYNELTRTFPVYHENYLTTLELCFLTAPVRMLASIWGEHRATTKYFNKVPVYDLATMLTVGNALFDLYGSLASYGNFSKGQYAMSYFSGPEIAAKHWRFNFMANEHTIAERIIALNVGSNYHLWSPLIANSHPVVRDCPLNSKTKGMVCMHTYPSSAFLPYGRYIDYKVALGILMEAASSDYIVDKYVANISIFGGIAEDNYNSLNDMAYCLKWLHRRHTDKAYAKATAPIAKARAELMYQILPGVVSTNYSIPTKFPLGGIYD